MMKLASGIAARVRVAAALLATALLAAAPPATAAMATASDPAPGLALNPATVAADLPAVPRGPADCLTSGDGYLHAHVGGAVDAKIDWPNQGTRCQGESRHDPAGVRLSFQRAVGGKPDLLFVFGITGTREGTPAHAVGVNLTVIVQGTDRIFGTLGDGRCTIDTLSQRPLPTPHVYRVEARGFCTQPAHAVRGNGDVLVSTFEFAGPVRYDESEPATLTRNPRP